MNPARRRCSLPVAVPTLLMSALLAGCGQTGPLHLPADAPAREHYLIGANPNAKPGLARAPADESAGAETAPTSAADATP